MMNSHLTERFNSQTLIITINLVVKKEYWKISFPPVSCPCLLLPNLQSAIPSNDLQSLTWCPIKHLTLLKISRLLMQLTVNSLQKQTNIMVILGAKYTTTVLVRVLERSSQPKTRQFSSSHYSLEKHLSWPRCLDEWHSQTFSQIIWLCYQLALRNYATKISTCLLQLKTRLWKSTSLKLYSKVTSDLPSFLQLQHFYSYPRKVEILIRAYIAITWTKSQLNVDTHHPWPNCTLTMLEW